MQTETIGYAIKNILQRNIHNMRVIEKSICSFNFVVSCNKVNSYGV